MNVNKAATLISDFLTCVLSLALFTYFFCIPLDFVEFIIYSISLFGLIEVLKRI